MRESEFAEAMLQRIRQARAADDVFAEAVAQDELEDAVRLARRHGIRVADTDRQEE
ncbi:hypothetical protein NGF19_21890 [Streptomyces sp. RY43-2]|uniref:Uncharacterized protein n=1 Tax=Streptomyces macrolidinus TaxID=2952607 RepID=A0ABT0ZIJ6_9ACTN|nr:hypothetical protein [Streptomyces macrolidinus]MCN9243403.1 hypothetical protein [Streptomyces macrolidinus]